MDHQDIALVLRGAGFRVTPQRTVILSAIRSRTGHVSAGEIADEVQAAFPALHVSTVYRALEAFAEAGLVTSSAEGGGDTVFEWVEGKGHHHASCHRCKSQVDIAESVVAAMSRQLERAAGFALDRPHYVFVGLCEGCRSAASVGR